MSKNEREKETIGKMLAIYCAGVHGTKEGLCEECLALEAYAHDKLDKCPFDPKPKCSNCTVHCYQQEQREAIREVMRYAGRRMLLKHPADSLRHLMQK